MIRLIKSYPPPYSGIAVGYNLYRHPEGYITLPVCFERRDILQQLANYNQIITLKSFIQDDCKWEVVDDKD